MDDNFQILNLTDNPFPQNPIIIIDNNDKRINGLIHYAKIFENENEKFKKFIEKKTNLIYISGSQMVRGDGKSAFIAQHYRQIEQIPDVIPVFIRCTDKNGRMNNPDRFCREFLIKLEEKNHLWRTFSKLLTQFVKDHPSYGYAYAKFQTLFSKFKTPPDQLPVLRYTKISNTKDLAKAFSDWLCDKCGCSPNTAKFFTQIYLEKPRELRNQLEKKADKIQEYDDFLKILFLSGFDHIYIFLDQMEDSLENIPTKTVVEFAAGMRRIIEKSNGKCTLICTLHTSSQRAILDNPQAKINITSLAPMDDNHKIMLFPENIKKNSNIVEFIKTYLSHFRPENFDNSEISPFEKDVLKYAAYLTEGNLRDILHAMYESINVALEQNESHIDMNFIKNNHRQIFGKDFSQESFDESLR